VDLICVGDVMLDVRVDAGALARGGDVHGKVVIQPGGTSSNAAAWAAATGASARVHAKVGRDMQGRLLRTELEARGVEASLVEAERSPTGTMLVVYEAGERSMVADRGANARLLPSDLPDRLEAGAVLVSGYLLLQDGARPAGRAAIRRASAPWVAVETASWPLVDTLGPTMFHELASGATAVLANELEAWTLTRLDADEAVRALGEIYRLACVKRGSNGAVLVVDGDLYRAPSAPIEEVDPTGAGDAFDGVLLGWLARGAEPVEALRAACEAGAAVAGGPSVWPEVRR
jgi:sugar/nucleoside kinase (ribokinase family)